MFLSAEGREYKEKVSEILSDKHELIEGPVGLQIVAYRPRKSGDLDNILKGLLDAMQGHIYVNDSQIVRIIAVRRDDKENPRVMVRVRRVKV